MVRTTVWLDRHRPRLAADSLVVVWAATPSITADIQVQAMGCGWANPSYTESPTMWVLF